MSFLVKFCEKKAYAHDLMNGKLYCNQVQHIQKLDKDSLRGDPDEGAILMGRSVDDVQMFIRLEAPGEEWHKIQGLAAVPRLRYDPIPNLHLFCMSVFQVAQTDQSHHEMVDQLRDMLSESLHDCKKMGGHAIVISNTREFERRVVAAADEAGFQHWYASVDYYDEFPADYHSWEQGSVKPLFLKASKYALQREVRLVLNTGTTDQDPVVLNIGAIDDIASYVPTASLANLVYDDTQLTIRCTPQEQIEALDDDETLEAVHLLLKHMCDDCSSKSDLLQHLLGQLCSPCMKALAPRIGLSVADAPEATPNTNGHVLLD